MGNKHPKTSAPDQRLTYYSVIREVPSPLLWHRTGNRILHGKVLEVKTWQEMTTRHGSKSYLFYYKTKVKRMLFSLTNNGIGRMCWGRVSSIQTQAVESGAFTWMNPTIMQFPPTHCALGWSAKKERLFLLAGRADDLHCGVLVLFSVPAFFSCHSK